MVFFMHPADISAALKKTGVSQTDIARRLKVGKAAVNGVIMGTSTSKSIEAEISSAAGIPLHILWPSRYVGGSQLVEPMPKDSAPNPLEALLLDQFRKLDLARQARALQLITELAGGASPSARVVVHGNATGNQLIENSNAPITVNMGKKR